MDFRTIKSLLKFQGFKCSEVEKSGDWKTLKATNGNDLIFISKDMFLNKFTVEKGTNEFDLEPIKVDISDVELNILLKCKL